MIRILHYGLDSYLGGIETYLYKLYSNIDKNEFKFDFLVIGNKKPCYYEEFIKMGSNFYKITPRSNNILKNIFELSKLLKEEHFDIIHFHLNSLSYITPIQIAIKNGIPIIVHSRNAGIINSKISVFLHKVNYYLLPKDKITMVSVSDLAGRWMFGEKADFKVINNGIDIKKYQYNEISRNRIRQELKLKDEMLIVHVGAMRRQKNHMFLLDIFNEVLKKQNNSKLLLVGDGELKEQILNKIYKLQIEDNVIILGNRNDIPDILSAADIFLFPSFYEGFPNAVLEAQTSGLPCLISDVITKEILINENCQTLSLDDDADEWAKKLLSLEQLKDRKMGAEKVKSKGFSVENEVKKIEKIYKELVIKR